MNDTISRQAAIGAIQAHKHNVLDAREYDEGVACGYAAAHNHICDVIAILPSAQPERKRGRWVLVCDNNGMHFICNKCGAWRYHQEQKFCGECGADMRGEQDG